MLFGAKNRFAVECSIDPKPSVADPEHTFGNIVLWAGGHRIGDPEATVILNLAADFFGNTLRYRGARRDEALADRAGPEMLKFLEAALFGEGGESVEDCLELESRFRKYVICPGGSESFDGEFAALVEHPSDDELLWKDFASKTIHSLTLEAGEYDRIMRSFLDWFQAESDGNAANP